MVQQNIKCTSSTVGLIGIGINGSGVVSWIDDSLADKVLGSAISYIQGELLEKLSLSLKKSIRKMLNLILDKKNEFII